MLHLHIYIILYYTGFRNFFFQHNMFLTLFIDHEFLISIIIFY